MANDSTPCNFEQVENGFVEAPKYIYPQISNKLREARTLYTNLLKREGFEYGQGYIKSTETFHGGVGIQDGGASFTAMAKSRAPLTNGANDPGYDACRDEALVVGSGIEEKSYTIYQSSRRTTDVCLTDMLFMWQLEQTLGLKIQSLAEITVQEWEQIAQAMYLHHAHKYFATADASDTLGVGLAALTMTPATGATFGGSIAIPAAGLGSISGLTHSLLLRLYPYLSRQCFKGALGMDGGMPIFGIDASPETIFEMMHNDAKDATYLQYADPHINVEGIGKLRTYKNYAQYGNMNAERYQVSADGTKLERVYPWAATPTTIDNALNVSADYLNAPFEFVKFIVKDVISLQVPPANPASLAGDYKFDPKDNIATFQFLNIQDRCENLLREKGFFHARMRVAPKPGQFSGDALGVLVRRCRTALETGCEVCDTANTAATTATVDFFDADGAYATAVKYIVSVTSCFSVEPGNRVAIVYTSNGGDTVYGVVSDNTDPLNLVVILDAAYTTRDLTDQTGITVATTAVARS